MVVCLGDSPLLWKQYSKISRGCKWDWIVKFMRSEVWGAGGVGAVHGAGHRLCNLSTFDSRAGHALNIDAGSQHRKGIPNG